MFANRRDFLFSAASSATVGLVWSGQRRTARAQEAPPETTSIRLAKTPSLCVMPQYVVDELLADEGLTQVDYVVSDSGPLLSEAIASGQIDFAMHFSGPLVLLLDRGRKVTMLAGVHVGCFELFAKDDIRSIADLKGRSVGISMLEVQPSCLRLGNGGVGRARSDEGHQLGDERGTETDRTVPRRQGRRLSRLSA